MTKCKTISLLEKLVETKSDSKELAASCLDIVENIRESGSTDSAIKYLHMLVDEIYTAGNISLLDHLRDGADCTACQEMLTRIEFLKSADRVDSQVS